MTVTIEDIDVRVRYAHIIYFEDYREVPSVQVALVLRSSRLALKVLHTIEQSPNFRLIEYREVLCNL